MIHSLLSVSLNGTYCETDVSNYSLAQWKRILKKIKKHAITIIVNVSLVYSVRIFLCPVGNQNQSLVNQALFAKFYQAKLSVPSDNQFQKQAGVKVFVWFLRLIHRSYLGCSMFSKTPVVYYIYPTLARVEQFSSMSRFLLLMHGFTKILKYKNPSFV